MNHISYESREDGDLLQTLLDWADNNDLPALTLHESCIGDGGPPIWQGFPKDKKTLIEIDHLILLEHNLLEIPSEIKCLTNLKEIYLLDNKLLNVPDEIFELPNLEHLDLSENEDMIITDTQRKRINELVKQGCEILLDDKWY